MKRIKLLTVAIFVTILFTTGCGAEKTLTCTNTQEASGVKMNQEVVMKFKKDKINYVKMTVSSKATSDLIKNNWDLFATTMDKQYTNKNSDGVKLTTKNNKAKYSYDIILEVNLEKASKDSLSEYGLSSIVGDTSTMSEVKKDAEKDGFTCK